MYQIVDPFLHLQSILVLLDTMLHRLDLRSIQITVVFGNRLPCIVGILLYFMDALGGVADCTISEEKQLLQKSRQQWLLKDVL